MKNLLPVELWQIKKRSFEKCRFNIVYAEPKLIFDFVHETKIAVPRIRAIFTPYKHLEVNIKLPICHEKKTHYS